MKGKKEIIIAKTNQASEITSFVPLELMSNVYNFLIPCDISVTWTLLLTSVLVMSETRNPFLCEFIGIISTGVCPESSCTNL